MASALKAAFTTKPSTEAAFVAFLTAGFPERTSTVPLLLALQASGADVIELGVPFSDPVADGPVIQAANNKVAIENGTTYADCLAYVKDARAQGLTVPVVLMGYANPLIAYGEQRAVQDAAQAGANGFIVVDLPPEAASDFRALCGTHQLSYIPLVAPSTSDSRIAFLATIADSFIYVVSKMATTGSSTEVSSDISALLQKVRKHTDAPLAVGFNISTRDHFAFVQDAGADGVVIGSKIIGLIRDAHKAGQSPTDAVEQFCRQVTGKDGTSQEKATSTTRPPLETDGASMAASALPSSAPGSAQAALDDKGNGSGQTSAGINQYYGAFGGAYVAESLHGCLVELNHAWQQAKADPAFQKEWKDMYEYMGRPSTLYHAPRLTKFAGGAQIWLKREDLNHTGSHKINNAVGQVLLAKRLGKSRIIAETGAGQHGVATATACARFGMKCTVYMGAEDVRRQALNVFRMQMLGAQVVSVQSGSKTLKDAINEAMREWVTSLSTTHYLIGSALGPHPFPEIVRTFQAVIGQEIKADLARLKGKLPDAVVACVGGGSNAIGAFHDFVEDKSVRLVGVEAGGDGIETERHSATLSLGQVGVLHGTRTYLLQTKAGQIMETHSISAGLDYPGVGPEHAMLKDLGRAEYMVANDEQALRAFRTLTEQEGIIPALETAHAVHGAIELAKTMRPDQDVVICLSGRGDKDVQQISEMLPGKWAERLDWHLAPTASAGIQ